MWYACNPSFVSLPLLVCFDDAMLGARLASFVPSFQPGPNSLRPWPRPSSHSKSSDVEHKLCRPEHGKGLSLIRVSDGD